MAQAGNLPEAPQPQDPSATEVQLIRSPSQSSTRKPPSTQTPNESTQQSGENKIITQAAPFPRSPRGPVPPSRGQANPSAFATRPPALSPLGALIGFGTGAALGATASGDQTTRGRVVAGLIGGSLCALIGGAIGHALSAVGHNFRDRHDWDDAQKRKQHKPAPHPLEPDRDASAEPTPAASVVSLGWISRGADLVEPGHPRPEDAIPSLGR
jgi:hypothetical protein